MWSSFCLFSACTVAINTLSQLEGLPYFGHFSRLHRNTHWGLCVHSTTMEILTQCEETFRTNPTSRRSVCAVCELQHCADFDLPSNNPSVFPYVHPFRLPSPPSCVRVRIATSRACRSRRPTGMLLEPPSTLREFTPPVQIPSYVHEKNRKTQFTIKRIFV